MAARDHDDAGDAIGRLSFRHPNHPEKYWLIRANDEFDIGRKHFQLAWNLNELTVSTHHLRFRCVMYEDDDDETKVAPMIYARVLSSNSIHLQHTGTDPYTSAVVVSKGDGDILLNHGDVLRLTPAISLQFEARETVDCTTHKEDSIRAAEVKRFDHQFAVSGRRLGSGAHASVFVAVKRPTQQQVACKIVPLPYTQSAAVNRIQQNQDSTPQEREAALKATELRLLRNRQNLAREYDVLKDLDHPNIIRLEKVIYASYNIYIFEELITGGDLLSYIDLKGSMTEAQAAIIVHQLLKAVNYLHSEGVVHRDLKPENVLMTSWRDGARIVVTDFGQSRTLQEAKTAAKNTSVFRMYSVVGTHGYTAPEALQNIKKNVQEHGYSKAIDIWSVGCISSLLLSGDMVFNEDYEFYRKGCLDTQDGFPPRLWDLSVLDKPGVWFNVGRKAKSFIKGCLVFDEGQRLTAKQALLHPWFTNKYYASELAAAYRRAIEDWTPRKHWGQLVEFMDTTDVVAPASRPEHIHRLVEEVKSRHFETSTPSARPFKFMRADGEPSRQKKLTPLPQISEVEAETLQVLASPPGATADALFADPSHDIHLTNVFEQDGNVRRLSIEDLGPPDTQLTTVPAAYSPL